MKKINPLICGLWDGCAIWLQWDSLDPGVQEYDLRIRYRKTESEAWTNWMLVIPRQGRKSHWAVVPTWKEGWQAQAQVRVSAGSIKPTSDLRPPTSDSPAPDSSDHWETASEVTFTQCTALFEFTTLKHPQHFEKETTFSSQVDGLPCTYMLLEPIEVLPGNPVRVLMAAMGASGYFQLDYPGHFDLKPSFGLRIQNVDASEEDVITTGRDFTEIRPKPAHDPVSMVISAPKSY